MLESKVEFKKTIDLFIRGWVYCRREPATELHDFDSMKHLDFGTNVSGRTDEFFIWDSNPDHILKTINKQFTEKDYWITLFSNEQPSGQGLEKYILNNSEFLMTLNLDNYPLETGTKAIRRVKTKEEAQCINNFFGTMAIDLRKLNDPCLHYYIAEENGEPTSHGSYSLLDKTVCLDKIFTLETHRGKGEAKALCRKMLFDAKQEGAVKSVLASSQMGHPLYLKLGYQDVSKMWMFKRRL